MLADSFPGPDNAELEVIDSPVATSWASEWTERTISRLDAESPHTRTALEQRFYDILSTDQRIPSVARRGSMLYNFWRDANHPRGAWRRVDETSYLAHDPQWQVLLDVDTLAADEGENWVWKGAHVRQPECDRALVRLSRGGEDATVVREFDLETCTFVDDRPFFLPAAKSDVSWETRDCIIIGTDLGPKSLTTSGYPARVYRWHRGTDYHDAKLLFTGEATDVAVGSWADTTPGYERVFISRSTGFFSEKRYLLAVDDDGQPNPIHIDAPLDCGISVHEDLIYLRPRAAFRGIPAGGLGVALFDSYLADPASTPVSLLWSPTAEESLLYFTHTKSTILISTLHNVASKLYTMSLHEIRAELRAETTQTSTVGLDAPQLRGDDDTSRAQPTSVALTAVNLPALSTTNIVDTSPQHSDEVWLSSSSYTLPPTLIRADATDPDSFTNGYATEPERYDAEGMTTLQLWATSSDGTRIPYFVTGKDLDAWQGAQQQGAEQPSAEQPAPRPCLVTAYGGFEVSMLPSYIPLLGAGLLERGYLVVNANIRGGGEFGPSWHTQAMTVNRHKAFEDCAAVLDDLVARGLTTHEQLALKGGSNGGLMAAVMLTRYAEKLGAVVSMVPLTDMLRYHTMLAGASWMAEYGDPADQEERQALAEYSPLHNVASHDGRPYPPCLVTTSTRDDRVHPGHARMFVAELARNGQPVDYVENSQGGHAGAATSEERAWLEAIVQTWLIERIGEAA